MLVLRLRPLAFATFLVWRLRIGACDVGACGFRRLWFSAPMTATRYINLLKVAFSTFRVKPFDEKSSGVRHQVLILIDARLTRVRLACDTESTTGADKGL